LRHPGYAGGLLSYFFSTLFLGAWCAAVFAAIVLPLAFLRRIRYEEELLVETFGKDYTDYQQQVGALFPALKLK
jgi:protein-S-isoprenylcysteine O-methyltransferase Ste14